MNTILLHSRWFLKESMVSQERDHPPGHPAHLVHGLQAREVTGLLGVDATFKEST